MFDKFNEKLTLAAVHLDERVHACSLLNLPEGPWKLFTKLLYSHFFLATSQFIIGTLCFCLGMQFSGMYSEVNCADGTNIWIPLLNLIASLSGLFSLRALHMHWPPFVHCIGLCVMLIMMLIPLVDSLLAAIRWFHEAEQPVDQWALNFSWIDVSLAIIAIINETIMIAILIPLKMYWYQSASSPSALPH